MANAQCDDSEDEDEDDVESEKKTNERAPTTRIKRLCPTRWTVNGAAMCSVLQNYANLQDLWEVNIRMMKSN